MSFREKDLFLRHGSLWVLETETLEGFGGIEDVLKRKVRTG